MNQVQLLGRIGQDPTRNGAALKFSVATSNGKDKEFDWHNCVAFDKTAETIEKYFKKGDLILIESGKIAYNKHEGKTYTNIIVNKFGFVPGSKQTEQAPQPQAAVVEDDDLPF